MEAVFDLFQDIKFYLVVQSRYGYFNGIYKGKSISLITFRI